MKRKVSGSKGHNAMARRFPNGGVDPLTYVVGNSSVKRVAIDGINTGLLIRRAQKPVTRAVVNAALQKAGV